MLSRRIRGVGGERTHTGILCGDGGVLAVRKHRKTCDFNSVKYLLRISR
jgi:hypothetical protein